MEINTTAASSLSASSRPPRAPIPAWYWVVWALISVLSVVGNGLVIYILGTRRRLHTSVNWFVLSLSTVDFFTGLFMPPVSLICVFSGVTCNRVILYTFHNVLLSISVASICTMTLDRYLGIVFPLKYHQWMTSPRVCALIASAWLVPTLLSCLPLTWVFLDIPGNSSRDAKRYHTAAMLVIFEFLPPLVMLVMYARILLTARRHARQTANQIAQLNYNQHFNTSSIRNRTERSARVIGAVILLFVACWFLDIYKSICQQFRICYLSVTAMRVSHLLLYFNAAVNPIAYALLKADVKKELRKMFCCVKFASMRTSMQMADATRNDERFTGSNTTAWQ